MTPRTYLPVVFCLLILTAPHLAPLQAQNDEALLSENHKTLALAVEGMGRNAVNLTTESIQTRTESRMRNLGIRPIPVDSPKTAPYLYVQVTVVANTYVISVKFMRFAQWSIPGRLNSSGIVATWTTEVIGSHGGDASIILGALNNEVDDFLNEYLKVNQDARQ